jgi:RNA polymerase sigma-70 factor (ECF subfamily)
MSTTRSLDYGAASSGTTAVDVDARFEAAYIEVWPAVFRFAAAWTNDLPSAEDIAQEAFARLWQRRRSIDWRKPVLPWLLVATRRLATDRFRRLRRVGRLIGPPRVVDLTEDGMVDWLDVRDAFRHLTDRERAALIAMSVIGLSAEDAAEPLGMTAGGVRAAASRGRQKLEARR